LFSKAYFLLIITTLSWAGNAVAGRMASDEWHSFTLTFLRWLFAVLCVLPFAWRHLQRDWPILKSHVWVLLGMGFFGLGAFNVALYTALHYTTAVNASIEQSVMPVLIILANFIIFRQRSGVLQLLGVAMSIIGVMITSTNGNPLGFFSGALNRGDALMLLGAVFYAAYTISLRWRPKVHWLSFLFVVGCGAILLTLPLTIWEVSLKGFTNPSPQAWAILAFMVIFPTIIAQIAFARAVELVGGNRAGLFINLVPVFGSVLAVVIIGESFHVFHAIGMTLVIGGIVLAERSAVQS